VAQDSLNGLVVDGEFVLNYRQKQSARQVLSVRLISR
jgi:hypothetical protein